MRRSFKLGLIISTIFLSSSLSAQVGLEYAPNWVAIAQYNEYNSNMSSDFSELQNGFARLNWERARLEEQYGDDEDEETSPDSEEQTRPINADPAAVLYNHSASGSKANINRFIVLIRKKDAAGADQLKQMFAQTSDLGAVHDKMRKVGLDPNNLSHCYTLYWTTMWQAINQDGSTISRQTAQAVAEQAEDVFLQTKMIAKLTNAEKQEYADILLIHSLLVAVNSEYFLSSGDKNGAASFAKEMRKGAKYAGLVIDGLTLTEDGFEPVES
jgi:hypothetical protein